MDAFPDRELVHDQSWGGGEPFPLSDAEQGIRKPQDDSSALARPLDRGKPLEIKVKSSPLLPRGPSFRKAAHPPGTRERGRKLLEKFLIKLRVSMVVMVVVL